MHYCTNCNGILVWQSDFTPEDIGMENLPDGIVSYYYCPVCDILTTFLYINDEVIILEDDM